MTIRVLQGDCRDVLPTLPANSVHTVVTSPPYYGLRDYNVAGQLGLEATPDEYIATMVQVFREVRRVLRDDGTCWVNMGDSYAGGIKGVNNNGEGASTLTSRARPHVRVAYNDGRGREPHAVSCGVAPKQLLMMPARLALALQQDGWWIRSDIIWHKPNPMPESVTDRPTSAHEHVFLLTKRSTYFYDADAVREEAQPSTLERDAYRRTGYAKEREAGALVSYLNPASGEYRECNGRNLRNVWSIATAPFPEAHFATYPPELAERCIRAGTSERGCCAHCGKPWVRVTDTQFVKLADRRNTRKALQDDADMADINSRNVMGYNSVTTTGWSRGCQCNAATQPCTVLDPFAGVGTSLLVADRLQRDGIAIELNPAYCAMLRNRITNDAPLFAEVTT